MSEKLYSDEPSPNIQSKLFNGRLDWQNNDIEWFHIPQPQDQPEPLPNVLSILPTDQLYFDLGGENETS